MAAEGLSVTTPVVHGDLPASIGDGAAFQNPAQPSASQPSAPVQRMLTSKVEASSRWMQKNKTRAAHLPRASRRPDKRPEPQAGSPSRPRDSANHRNEQGNLVLLPVCVKAKFDHT